jgi:hypothetical protein
MQKMFKKIPLSGTVGLFRELYNLLTNERQGKGIAFDGPDEFKGRSIETLWTIRRSVS